MKSDGLFWKNLYYYIFLERRSEDPQFFNDVFQDISLLKGHMLAFTPAEVFRQFVRGAKDAKTVNSRPFSEF